MTTSEGCAFCGITEGEVEADRVYEDEETVAFLDANPATRGHTLVVPRRHAERLTDLDEVGAAALFVAARRVAGTIEEELEPTGLNLLQNNGAAAGQEVDHVHVHLIPRYGDDGVEMRFDRGELGEDEAEELTERLRTEAVVEG